VPGGYGLADEEKDAVHRISFEPTVFARVVYTGLESTSKLYNCSERHASSSYVWPSCMRYTTTYWKVAFQYDHAKMLEPLHP